MKCPECNNDLMSFLHFYLIANPFGTKCKECGTKVKPNSIITESILEVIICLV